MNRGLIIPFIASSFVMAATNLVLGSERGSAASVTEQPREFVEATAAQLDAIIARGLADAGVNPLPIVDDPTFLRRTYLTIAGRIPSADETDRFLGSRARGRREALIDELLDSEAYESRMFAFVADLLRVRERLADVRYISGEPYIHYIRQSIADNMPYDQFVTELLTAEGPIHARDNGATGYLMRDRGMPEDSMANTIRVFLGTRLECAQCHDHPFDRWTQREFFEMAAFTGGLEYRDLGLRTTDGGRRLVDLGKELKRSDPRGAYRGFKRAMRSVVAGVSGTGTGVAQLPKDYQYDDLAPKSWVVASTIFGADADLGAVDVPTKGKKNKKNRKNKKNKKNKKKRAKKTLATTPAEIDSRVAYADWLTSPDNPRFAGVIANRLWKLAMGRGVVEPVDNWTEQTVPANPALMDALRDLMVEVDFDLKRYLRVVLNTELWQREVASTEPPIDQPYRFAGPVMRRMTGEQMWDSLLTLVLDDVDATIMPTGARAEPVYQRYEEFLGQSEQELMAVVDREALRYTDPSAYKKANKKAKAARNKEKNQLKKLFRKLKKATLRGDDEAEASLREQILALGADPDRPGSRKRSSSMLLRASELSQPAPDDHLLRVFGQSDREQIESSHTEATVPQALALMNGFLEEQVLINPNSSVSGELAAVDGSAARIRAAYRTVLSRDPTSSELSSWRSYASRHGGSSDAWRDLVWTLVNTHEFRLVR